MSALKRFNQNLDNLLNLNPDMELIINKNIVYIMNLNPDEVKQKLKDQVYINDLITDLKQVIPIKNFKIIKKYPALFEKWFFSKINQSYYQLVSNKNQVMCDKLGIKGNCNQQIYKHLENSQNLIESFGGVETCTSFVVMLILLGILIFKLNHLKK